MPNTTILISKLLQKQMRIVAGAVAVSIVVTLLSILESRNILPKGISIVAIYGTLLFIWPCLSSISGAMIPSCTVPQSTQKNPGGVSRRTTALFLQLITAILLAIIGVAAAFGVFLQIPMTGREANPPLPHFIFNTYSDFPPAWDFGIDGPFKWMQGIFVSLVCFACALLFSSLLSRTRPAAIAGLVSGLSISFMIFIRLDLPLLGDSVPLTFDELRLIMSLLALTILLVILTFILRWNRNGSVSKTIFSGSLLCAGSALIVFFSFAYPLSIRLSPSSAETLYMPYFSADGEMIIVTAFKRIAFAPQIWGIPVNGKNIRRLTGRLAVTPFMSSLYAAPFMSPDGNWIGYFSRQNFLGILQNHLDLRMVRVDGTEDRLLVSRLKETDDTDPERRPDIACSASAFSPDSNRIAVVCKDVLTVVELRSGHCINITLPLEWPTHLAWNNSGSEILISPGFASGSLFACDPATGRIRTIRENTKGRREALFLSTARGMRFVLIGNSLLDLQTNKEQLVDEKCYRAGISSDDKSLVYTTPHWINPMNAQEIGTEIHWREIASGKEEIAAILPNSYLSYSLLISPSGERVIVNSDRAIVIERSGAMRYFPPGWSAFGWAGNDQVGLRSSEKLFPLALGDVETMKLRILNP
jgi:hypothetical protein